MKGIPDLSVLRRNFDGYASPDTTYPVEVAGLCIGSGRPAIIAGPCTVESAEQTLRIAWAVKKAGCRLMRGGAFKPRTNPHSFQGLGVEGLRILADVRRETGLGIVTEVMDPRLVETVAEYADMLQVGSRSMQNFPLLREVGKMDKPVLLKRGFAATLEEWLCAAEYIAMEGNRKIVLCERGIRADCHHEYARHVLDLNVLPILRGLTPLPIVVDPSHAAGRSDVVPSLSRAALAAGADGLLIEAIAAEPDRERARCDGSQAIVPETLQAIVEDAAILAMRFGLAGSLRSSSSSSEAADE